MKKLIPLFAAALIFSACSGKKQTDADRPVIGSWKLVSAMMIKEGDTTVTDFTRGEEMIKIITPTHFSFLRHDLNKGKDSTALFVAGGGTVTFGTGKYTEHLDYCSSREWEGGVFDLSYEIKGDTLITTSIEKIESLGVNHLNVEKLVRIK